LCIARYQNPHLIEFYDELRNELQRLSLFVHVNIRKESYIALAGLVAYFHDYCICNLDKADAQTREKMITSELQVLLKRTFTRLFLDCLPDIILFLNHFTSPTI
jgi:hypothetical protein